jgi:chemotaxis protein methyltransferase CheR
VTATAIAVVDELPLSAIEDALERACGLSLSTGVRPALADAVRRASKDLGLAREPFLSRLLGGDPAAVTALVEHAVVKETYFYRHPEQWAAVTRQLAALPLERPLSAWSAGCATGEEAYTMAMVLHDAGRRGGSDRVLGTDISARALALARAGRYREWSLRALPDTLRARHFTSEPDALCVQDERRASVRFAQHDLLGGPPPEGPFDLVACRNVLLYFKPAAARTVLGRLHAALRPGGMLLVGPIEEPLTAGLPFERLEGTGATVLRRPGAAGAST